MSANRPLPDYENPPVSEVVCGITFEPLVNLLIPHFGGLWDRFRAEYPDCQEVPPLAQVTESVEDSGGVNLTFTQTPPLPRIWFTHKDRRGIIQVQRDRFLHNWVKASDEQDYPRYPVVIEMFRKYLTQFEEFITSSSLGQIKPLQCELTYVNHIPQGAGWQSLAEIGNVFPDLDRRKCENRFLTSPEGLNYRIGFAMPDKSGRLLATLTNAKRRSDNLPILILDLTARGMPKNSSNDGIWQWFNVAHEWIVRGFEDLTNERVQTDIWRKR